MSTTTTYYAFTKPSVGDSNWGTTMNTNLDAIDQAIGVPIYTPGTPAYASSTVTYNATLAREWAPVALTSNSAVAVTGIMPGQSIILRFKQDSTGSRTLTWPSGTVGSATLQTAAGAVDKVEFTCRATGVYEIAIRGTFAS